MKRSIIGGILLLPVAFLITLPANAATICDSLKAIVAAADESTAFESLNSHTPTPAGRMVAKANLPGFACTIEPDKSRTFFSCKQASSDGGAAQIELAKQASTCFGTPAVNSTASMNDVLSTIELNRVRRITVAVRWSASFGELSVNTIAADR